MRIKQLLCLTTLFCFIFSSYNVYAGTEDLQPEVYQVRFMLCSPDGQIVENKQVSTNSQPLMIQSTSIATDPPILLSASYWLNDEEQPWEQIAGQAGILRVELVIVNQHQDENSKENIPYLTQIQVPLDLRSSTLIEAPLADRVTVGYIQTLSFSGLLQSTMLATWTAFSDHWSQDSVQITLIPKIIDIPLPDIAAQINMQLHGLNSMDSGVSKMLEGMQIMEKSLNDLNKGFRDYQMGFRQWSKGFQELNSKLPEIIKAFDEYLTHMYLIQDGVDQIQVALGEAEVNFKNLQKEMEQTQQAILLLGMTLNQLTNDHQEALTLGAELIEQNASISSLANDILLEYPKDSDPWNLASQVLNQSQTQHDLVSIIQGQSKKLTMINNFILEMQKKMKEEYLPLLNESYTAYQELIKGIDQIDDGLHQMTEGLKQGRKGSLDASKGSQELFEALMPLRQARMAIAEGIRALSQAPRMIILSLRQLRFQGILPMSRASKSAQDNFIQEKNRQNRLKNIVEQHRNQAVIIKIDYTMNAIQSEKDDPSIQQTPKAKNQNPMDRIKEWLRSLF